MSGHHHLARVADGQRVTLDNDQVMIGAVHAIDGQRSDVPVSGAHVGQVSFQFLDGTGQRQLLDVQPLGGPGAVEFFGHS